VKNCLLKPKILNKLEASPQVLVVLHAFTPNFNGNFKNSFIILDQEVIRLQNLAIDYFFLYLQK